MARRTTYKGVAVGDRATGLHSATSNPVEGVCTHIDLFHRFAYVLSDEDRLFRVSLKTLARAA